MFNAFVNNAEAYKAQKKADQKIWDNYIKKVNPELWEKFRKDRRSKLLSSFYVANLGFDPEEEKSTGKALVRIEYKTPKFKADDLRTLWSFAVDYETWGRRGTASRSKSKFTLYNPNGKAFRVKARIGAYIKATPVGLFALAFDIVINNHYYLKEGYINLKHVRWITHPFTGLSKMKPEERVLIEFVTGLTGKKTVPSIRCQKAEH